jgi:hypothetical protein
MFENAMKLEKEMKKQNSYNDIRNQNKWKNNELSKDSLKATIRQKQSAVKYLYYLLINEDKDKDINYKKYTTSEEKRDDTKKKAINEISPVAKKYIKKAKTKINEMNKSTLEIAKLNYLYFLNKPKVCDVDEKNRTLKNRVNNSCINIHKKNIFKNLNDKSLMRNFEYINNNFHKQFNDAFNKYNPIAHLNNMKLLLEAVPSFYDDISKVKEEVKNDIDFKMDKEKFKNKYENIKKKQEFLPINNKQKLKNNNRKNNIKISLCLPKIKIKAKEEMKKCNPLDYINKFRKNKAPDFKKLKINKIEELNKFIQISDNINDLIKKDTIENKIEKFVDHYNLAKYEKNPNKDYSTIDLKKIDYFQNEKSLIEEKLKKIYLNKYFNSTNEKENKLFNKYKSQIKEFTKKNENNRNSHLNEFDIYLSSKNISISDN